MVEKAHIPSSGSPSYGEAGRQRSSDSPTGALPSGNPGAEKNPEISGELPADEGSDAAPRTLPSEQSGSLPARELEGSKTNPRRERIRRSTAEGGFGPFPADFEALPPHLQQEWISKVLPSEFEQEDDGDWQVVESDNPFEVLYLDHEQYQEINDTVVEQNYRLLRAFWEFVEMEVKGPLGEILVSKYGRGNPAKVREHKTRTTKAYKQLKEQGLAASYKGIDAKRRQAGEEQLLERIEDYLVDGILSLRETKALFDKGKVANLKEEEIANLLDRELKARGFKSAKDPQGVTLAERLQSVQWRVLEEQVPYSPPLQVPPLTIGEGKAHSVRELIDVCDANWDEAQEALFHGYIAQWLGGNLGNTALAREARQTQKLDQNDQSKGLELFLRVLSREVDNPAYPVHPIVTADPDKIDLGDHPIGEACARQIQLSYGRRRAWGSVRVEPNLPGLIVSTDFDVSHASIDLRLDTLHVPQGAYEGNLVIQPEGASEPTCVSVQYRVIPLEVKLFPAALDLGHIAFGKTVTKNLKVTSVPGEGRLTGTVSLSPPVEGVRVVGELTGSVAALQVLVDAARLKAGKSYTTRVRLDTNAGVFKVPVSFQVAINRMTVLGWTAGVGLATGLFLKMVRAVLTDADSDLSGWFLSYSEDSDVKLAAGLLFFLLVATAGTVLWLWKQRKTKETLPKKA